MLRSGTRGPGAQRAAAGNRLPGSNTVHLATILCYSAWGARPRDWRLVNLDGSPLVVVCTEEYEEAFGRPGGTSAFPKLRFVALPGNDTHVLGVTLMEPFATDELTMARSAVPALGDGMICLADRFFRRRELWQSAAKTVFRAQFFGQSIHHNQAAC